MQIKRYFLILIFLNFSNQLITQEKEENKVIFESYKNNENSNNLQDELEILTNTIQERPEHEMKTTEPTKFQLFLSEYSTRLYIHLLTLIDYLQKSKEYMNSFYKKDNE